MPQLAKVEAEAPFEQDQCHANCNHGFEQFAKGMLGIEYAEHGACQEASSQHQHDSRPASPPGNPLRTNAEYADKRYDKCLFHAPRNSTHPERALSNSMPYWCELSKATAENA